MKTETRHLGYILALLSLGLTAPGCHTNDQQGSGTTQVTAQGQVVTQIVLCASLNTNSSQAAVWNSPGVALSYTTQSGTYMTTPHVPLNNGLGCVTVADTPLAQGAITSNSYLNSLVMNYGGQALNAMIGTTEMVQNPDQSVSGATLMTLYVWADFDTGYAVGNQDSLDAAWSTFTIASPATTVTQLNYCVALKTGADNTDDTSSGNYTVTLHYTNQDGDHSVTENLYVTNGVGCSTISSASYAVPVFESPPPRIDPSDIASTHFTGVSIYENGQWIGGQELSAALMPQQPEQTAGTFGLSLDAYFEFNPSNPTPNWTDSAWSNYSTEYDSWVGGFSSDNWGFNFVTQLHYCVSVSDNGVLAGNGSAPITVNYANENGTFTATDQPTLANGRACGWIGMTNGASYLNASSFGAITLSWNGQALQGLVTSADFTNDGFDDGGLALNVEIGFDASYPQGYWQNPFDHTPPNPTPAPWNGDNGVGALWDSYLPAT